MVRSEGRFEQDKLAQSIDFKNILFLVKHT